ncbi:type II toxin-antitoxin system HigB family toxin [Rubritalea spongiae]|uniref:Type II toxin-antitoxin system HigB family toxin n=1 Tax=Rubritalea spongiae TaxID=430797 RepID=A0ABW5E2N3_9BACT
MRIVGKPILEKFMKKHARARSPLSAWVQDAIDSEWLTPQDIKNRYNSADFLKDNKVVFNIGGNNFRLVVIVRYQNGIVMIDKVGTHAEYNKWKLD